MRISTLALCASILANPLYAQSLAQPVDPSLSERRQIENTWILTFNEDVDFEEAPGRARGLAARFGGEVVHEYSAAFRGAALRMNDAAIARLLQADDTDVIRAERDQIAYLSKKPSWAGGGGGDTDSSSGCTQDVGWGTTRVVGILDNSSANLSDSCESDGTLKFIGNYSATNISVCVLDTGIDLDHPDLNVSEAGFSVFTTGRDAGFDDKNGHGSHVAGTIGAISNDFGVLGVAPGVEVIPVKVLNSRGSGTVSGVIAGVDQVGALGCDVANMSLNTPFSLALNTAVESASAGVLFTLSAGNNSDNANKYSPASAGGANYPNIFTVAASTSGDGWASFSNYGFDVDYIMPGAGILSTYKDGGYRTADGTSMAAPHLAGILARDLAMDNALDDTISDGKTITGPDREYELRVDPTTSAPAPEETSDPAG